MISVGVDFECRWELPLPITNDKGFAFFFDHYLLAVTPLEFTDGFDR